MRRRFGRGRRRGSGGSSGSEPIDPDRWLGRLSELDRLGLEGLTAEDVEELPEHFAIVARAQRAGAEVLLGFSPTSGSDAALAVLGHALRRSGPGAETLAISPCWSGADRRRLALLGDPLISIEVPELAEIGGTIRAEPNELAVPLTTEQVAAGVRPGDRDLFRRGIAGLEGLAAKHGGTVRASGEGIELVVLAQRAALLAVSGSRLRLETPAPDRSQIELASEGLSTALDRLEGSLRKRLNDRRSRSGEEGLRAGLVSVMGRAVDAVTTRPWPLQTHPEREIIDLIGADGDGRCFVGAAREAFDLPGLGEVLDATLALRPILPLLLGSDVAVSADPPRLVLAAERFDEIVLSALSGLLCEAHLFDVGSRRGGGHTLEVRSPWERPERAMPALATPSERVPETAAEALPMAPEEVAETPPPRRAQAAEEPAGDEPASGADAGTQEAGGIEEISLFDLDDEGRGDEEEQGARRRRRGRRRGRRGRGRPGGGSDRSDDSDERGAEASAEDDRPPPAPERREDEVAVDDPTEDEILVVADDDEDFAQLADDAPDLDEAEIPAYEEDEDEESEDEEGPGAEEARRERERRRRSRAAKPPEPEPVRQARRRAAFVACADRASILTALVLARDLRLVEGFWVYPQSELMTFFRSIATDLRDDTPIHLVGFNASPPARDTIQAAALYQGRLDWYDHHDWPPEDLLALRDALGEDRVHVSPGAENPLSTVLTLRTRRSRFSDKLVELMTGRFSQHDYERWGRLWWHRLGELVNRPGERRSDIDPLLVGRPSELARRAADIPVPEPPPEVAYVSSRDFRLVHFGGFVMVVLEVPPELDLHLSARVARERYEATISLAHRPGGELLVLGGDEGPARRGLDLGAMTAHLAAKLEWVEALADEDHVARMRVRDLWGVDGRMDEVVAEIAMGRSIVEG